MSNKEAGHGMSEHERRIRMRRLGRIYEMREVWGPQIKAKIVKKGIQASGVDIQNIDPDTQEVIPNPGDIVFKPKINP